MRMRRYSIVLVTAIGFLLSGCMVGPRYVKPSVPVTPNFEEIQESKGGTDGRSHNRTTTLSAESGGSSMATQR